MRYSALATVLIGLSALCWTSCSVSRKASEVSSSRIQVSSVERAEAVERVDSVIVEQRDTLREVTTITIDRNDKGDTLRVTQVTDRTKIRDANRFRVQDSRLTVKTDTVYIEKRDSVSSTTNYTNFTNPAGKKDGFWTKLQKTLKWIVALICAVIALIITIKVCLRKGLF